MSALTPAVEAALTTDTPIVAGLLKIELPGATILLLDGAGTLEFDGDTYTGKDAVFGSLAAVSEIRDGLNEEVPGISFTLHPANDAAAAELAAPTMQGSPVSLWLAAIDPSTGEVIPDPYALFIGELDQPTLTVDQGERELEYECVSSMEKLFANVEGVRLADSWHKNVWPGETGLANVSGIIKTIYWGVHGVGGSVVTGGSAGGLVGGIASAIGVQIGRTP